MTIEYTITAHPTLYNGRQYRSRLEAKWAAFFDKLNWKVEFEPFDLGEWSPDFMLLGATPVLVEVKPLTRLDVDTIERMGWAARSAKWRGDLLLVGVSPFLFDDFDGNPAWLGWLGEYVDGRISGGSQTWPDDWGFSPCHGIRADNGSIDFCHSDFSYGGRMTGKYDGSYDSEGAVIAEARRLWDAACNAVQWQCNRT